WGWGPTATSRAWIGSARQSQRRYYLGDPLSSACTYGYPCDLPCLRRSVAWRGEDVDALTGSDSDNRTLRVRTLAEAVPCTPLLPRPVEGVHVRYPHLENRLHRDLDLGLVRPGGHQEGVLVLVQQPIALLAHHRREQDVASITDLDAAHFSSSSDAP